MLCVYKYNSERSSCIRTEILMTNGAGVQFLSKVASYVSSLLSHNKFLIVAVMVCYHIYTFRYNNARSQTMNTVSVAASSVGACTYLYFRT
jgi:hypothetical protein